MNGRIPSTPRHRLLPGIIPAVVIMLFILVYLFNAFLPPLIIVATIPFAFIGITAGLLAFDISFGFMALARHHEPGRHDGGKTPSFCSTRPISRWRQARSATMRS